MDGEILDCGRSSFNARHFLDPFNELAFFGRKAAKVGLAIPFQQDSRLRNRFAFWAVRMVKGQVAAGESGYSGATRYRKSRFTGKLGGEVKMQRGGIPGWGGQDLATKNRYFQ